MYTTPVNQPFLL